MSVVGIPGRATLRSAAKQDLFVPRTRLVSSERAFSVAGPKAWNKLPVDIRLTTDTKLIIIIIIFLHALLKSHKSMVSSKNEQSHITHDSSGFGDK